MADSVPLIRPSATFSGEGMRSARGPYRADGVFSAWLRGFLGWVATCFALGFW